MTTECLRFTRIGAVLAEGEHLSVEEEHGVAIICGGTGKRIDLSVCLIQNRYRFPCILVGERYKTVELHSRIAALAKCVVHGFVKHLLLKSSGRGNDC